METNMKTKPILCYERHPLRTGLAFDSAPAALSRKPAAPVSVPAKPSVSPKPAAPRKPAVDSPSRQESLQAILDFLSGALPSALFSEVETALEQYVSGSQEPETAYRPAADRRPRVAADSGSMEGFYGRFPAARRIGAA
jgi:hypothetical protein